MNDIDKQKNNDMIEDVKSKINITQAKVRSIAIQQAEVFAEQYVSVKGLEEEERDRVKKEYIDLFVAEFFMSYQM